MNKKARFSAGFFILTKHGYRTSVKNCQAVAKMVIFEHRNGMYFEVHEYRSAGNCHLQPSLAVLDQVLWEFLHILSQRQYKILRQLFGCTLLGITMGTQVRKFLTRTVIR